MKMDIGTINSYGGNVAVGNSGPVHQQAQMDAMALHQQFNTFTEKVKTETRYDAARKREAVAELNTLSEQVTLPPAQREESKVRTALKLLPGLLSSINALAQEWDKLEPWLRSHFGG
jgi:cytochrome c556